MMHKIKFLVMNSYKRVLHIFKTEGTKLVVYR